MNCKMSCVGEFAFLTRWEGPSILPLENGKLLSFGLLDFQQPGTEGSSALRPHMPLEALWPLPPPPLCLPVLQSHVFLWIAFVGSNLRTKSRSFRLLYHFSLLFNFAPSSLPEVTLFVVLIFFPARRGSQEQISFQDPFLCAQERHDTK